MSDDGYLIKDLPGDTPLAREMMEQMSVSLALSAIVEQPIITLSMMRQIVEKMEQAPPEGIFADDSGLAGLPVTFSGFELEGMIVWDPTGELEPCYVVNLRISPDSEYAPPVT